MTVYADATNTVPIPSEEDEKAHMVGRYQGVTVDLETGELVYDPIDWRLDPKSQDSQVARADQFPTLDYEPAGRYVRWMLDSGFDDHTVDPPRPRPYLNAEAINELLDELAPAVEQFVEHMVPVPGRRGLWDFSRQAVAVGEAISRRVHRDHTPIPAAIESDAWVRDMDELAAHYEGFTTILNERFQADQLDRLSDKEIARAAEDCGRGAGRLERVFPGIQEIFGLEGDRRGLRKPVVVGTTAYLCGVRERLAQGRTVIDADHWFAMNPIPTELVDLENGELDSWIEQFTHSLDPQGIVVVGIREWTMWNRPELHEQVREELARLGQQAQDAEQAAKAAKQRRNALISRILSWGDERTDTDTALGKRARVSHTTIANLRGAADDTHD